MSTPIENGKKVTFKYTLTVDGKTVQSSPEDSPMQYVQGEGRLLPGLERRLEGLSEGQTENITVPSEEAYGEVKDDAFVKVPREQFSTEREPEVGLAVVVQKEDQKQDAVITEVTEEHCVLDLNHPLAGRTLNFEVNVLKVEPA